MFNLPKVSLQILIVLIVPLIGPTAHSDNSPVHSLPPGQHLKYNVWMDHVGHVEVLQTALVLFGTMTWTALNGCSYCQFLQCDIANHP